MKKKLRTVLFEIQECVPGNMRLIFFTFHKYFINVWRWFYCSYMLELLIHRQIIALSLLFSPACFISIWSRTWRNRQDVVDCWKDIHFKSLDPKRWNSSEHIFHLVRTSFPWIWSPCKVPPHYITSNLNQVKISIWKANFLIENPIIANSPPQLEEFPEWIRNDFRMLL